MYFDLRIMNIVFQNMFLLFSDKHHNLEAVEALSSTLQIGVIAQVDVVTNDFNAIVDGVNLVISVVIVLVLLIGNLAVVYVDDGSVIDCGVLVSVGTHFLFLLFLLFY